MSVRVYNYFIVLIYLCANRVGIKLSEPATICETTSVSSSTGSWGSCARRRRLGIAWRRGRSTGAPRLAPGASSTGNWDSWTSWGRPGNRARCTEPACFGGVGGGGTGPIRHRTDGDAGTRSRIGRRRCRRRRCSSRPLLPGRPDERARPTARCCSADSWGTEPGLDPMGNGRRRPSRL